MNLEHDSLKGAIAYIDGAIELWPKAQREARVATFLRPIRTAAEAGEIVILLWVLLLMLPGVGLAVVLQQSVVASSFITLFAVLAGWGLYSWAFANETSATTYGPMLRQEFEQVERFFYQARLDPHFAQYMTWEGGNPLRGNGKLMLRTLTSTKRKLEWLCDPKSV